MSDLWIAVKDGGRLEINKAFLPLLVSNSLATFKALMSHPRHVVALKESG
jgi:hypothetical protein